MIVFPFFGCSACCSCVDNAAPVVAPANYFLYKRVTSVVAHKLPSLVLVLPVPEFASCVTESLKALCPPGGSVISVLDVYIPSSADSREKLDLMV